VVGHSYGGAIISDAATGVANVVGLVFASAFAPDEGETLGELNARFAPPPGVAHFQVDSLGFVWLDPAAFPANFVQDVALQEARVMAAVQEPIGQPSPSRRGRRRGGGCRRGPGLHRVSG
jgi:alpha/beta hydrolase family protein